MKVYLSIMVLSLAVTVADLTSASAESSTDSRYFLTSYKAADGRDVQFRISSERFHEQPSWNPLDNTVPTPLSPSEALAAIRKWFAVKYPDYQIGTVIFIVAAPITDTAAYSQSTDKWYYTIRLTIISEKTTHTSSRIMRSGHDMKGYYAEKPATPNWISAVVLMDGTIVEPSIMSSENDT